MTTPSDLLAAPLGPVTRVEIRPAGAHVELHLWLRGAKAGGSLKFRAGEWGELTDLLRPRTLEVLRPGPDVLPGQVGLPFNSAAEVSGDG